MNRAARALALVLAAAAALIALKTADMAGTFAVPSPPVTQVTTQTEQDQCDLKIEQAVGRGQQGVTCTIDGHTYH